MNKYKYLAASLLAAFVFTGCSGGDKSSSSASEPDTATTVQSETAEETTAPVTTEATEPATEKYDIGDVLPVLSIETVSTDPDVLDFVELPVAEHVAENIASWTPGYEIPPAPYYEKCKITLTDTDNNVLISGAEADVKVRGNWTTTYDKKPLRIKFAEKQGLLGLNDGAEMKNWVLIAGYKDGSLLRDKTALDISREILGSDGLFAPDSELVEVEINGQYYGVYLLTDRLQVSKNRVAVTEPEKDYTGTDIGYFMEFDGYYTNEDDLHSFFIDYADNAPLIPFDGTDDNGKTITVFNEITEEYDFNVGVTIHSDIYSPEQKKFIESYMNNVYRIMYSAAYEDKAYRFNDDYSAITEAADLTPQQAVELAVNVNSLADMYVISELTCDADIYWSSFYMDVDFGAEGDRKLRFEAPWDFDSSMGNKDRCADATGFYAANIVADVNDFYDTVNPWLAVLMQEEWFRDIVREKWTAAYDNGVFERAINNITADSEKFEEAFTRNYKKWNNILNNEAYANELSEGAANCCTQDQAADYLADWLTKRVSFLNDYWHK